VISLVYQSNLWISLASIGLGRLDRKVALTGRSIKFERFSITHERAIQRLGKTVCLGTRLAKLELGLIAGISTRTVT
jgi:hypothetical protein